MANDTPIYGLFHRGEDEPILAGKDADMLQRLRKREHGDDPDYKVAPVDKAPEFAEPTEPEGTTAGLDQRKAEIRHKLFNESLEEELKGQVESDAGEDASEAAELVEDSGSDNADELTGDALDARAAELNIEGRSSMSADDKRAAIKAAEADQA